MQLPAPTAAHGIDMRWRRRRPPLAPAQQYISTTVQQPYKNSTAARAHLNMGNTKSRTNSSRRSSMKICLTPNFSALARAGSSSSPCGVRGGVQGLGGPGFRGQCARASKHREPMRSPCAGAGSSRGVRGGGRQPNGGVQDVHM